jgi:hypothetical protein
MEIDAGDFGDNLLQVFERVPDCSKSPARLVRFIRNDHH